MAKNQEKLIFEVKYPFNQFGNLLNVILGQDTPSKHVLWYIIPLSHAYVYLAWALGPLCRKHIRFFKRLGLVNEGFYPFSVTVTIRNW